MAERKKLEEIPIGATVNLPSFGECVFYGVIDGVAVFRPKRDIPPDATYVENSYLKSKLYAFMYKGGDGNG